MAFISSVVAVSFYFDKRRSIAIGIAVCGTGVGTFAVAPLTNALLSEYSWKGTSLIQAGLLLNCIICGMLFRPIPSENVAGDPPEKLTRSCTSSTQLPKPLTQKNVFRTRSLDRIPRNRNEYDRSTTSLKEHRESRMSISWPAKINVADVEQEKAEDLVTGGEPRIVTKCAFRVELSQMSAASSWNDRRRHSESVKPTLSHTHSTELIGTAAHNHVFHTRSLDRIPQHRAECDDCVVDKSWLEKIDITNEQKEIPTNVVESGQPEIKVKSASTLDLAQTYAAPSTNATRRRRRLSDSEKSTVSRKSTVSLRSLQHFAGRVTQPAFAKSLEHIPQYRVDRDSDYCSVTSVEAQSNKSWPEEIENTKTMWQKISKLTIFRLFLDSAFVLFAISVLLTGIALVVPYVFLPNRGLRLGFDSGQSSLLISAVGISNTIGRIVFGFVASIKQVNSLMLYSTMLIICGICSLFSVVLLTLPLQMFYAVCFGFLIGKLSFSAFWRWFDRQEASGLYEPWA